MKRVVAFRSENSRQAGGVQEFELSPWSCSRGGMVPCCCSWSRQQAEAALVFRGCLCLGGTSARWALLPPCNRDLALVWWDSEFCGCRS